MNNKVVVRIATQQDAQFIALLGRITYKETYHHLFKDDDNLFKHNNKTFSVNKIIESINKTNNIFWIALVDNLPVGYAKLIIKSNSEFINFNNSSQLQKIYIINDFISKKIGYELLTKLILKAKTYTEYLWLLVVKDNKRAINFYKKNNFTIIGNDTIRLENKILNCYIMSKQLS